MRDSGDWEMDLAGWLLGAAVPVAAIAFGLALTEPRHGADVVLFWSIMGAWGVVTVAAIALWRRAAHLERCAARRVLDRMRSLEAAKPRRKGERP